MNSKSRHPASLAVIGNYVPRRCGIATFTTDLCNALAEEVSTPENVIALAMDDIEGGYPYPERVKFEIRDNVSEDYMRAADYLNIHKVEIAILQHEYGIFGGKYGASIFQLLENLKMPIIATLHTVLSAPNRAQKAIIFKLGMLCDQLVSMSEVAKDLLIEYYAIPENKITIIPHGIPDVPFVDTCYYKDMLGLKNRKVILTFGLLGPGKGLETMIDAMLYVVKSNPDVMYIILGATHPHVIKATGEKYRHGLTQRIRRLNLEKHVMFYNQFVDLPTLIKFIKATDIFVTPYPGRDQIASGTLSYALGAGKAVVSTPYFYAEEQLADGRGVLVPFENPSAMGSAVAELLSSETLRNTIRKQAYQYGRHMIWKEVGRAYLNLAQLCLERQTDKPGFPYSEVKTQIVNVLPKTKLDHLRVMTDDTGMLQHCFFSIPNRDHGYCVDDNARALIAVSLYSNLKNDISVLPLLKIYLSFLLNAFNPDKGRFRNFMSYDRSWLDEAGSEDSHGRAVWALGTVIEIAPTQSIQDAACRLFLDSIGSTEDLTYPRAWAFSLMGVQNYLNFYSGDATVRKIRASLAEKLFKEFEKNMTSDWLWYNDTITYANALLPHALLIAGHSIAHEKMFDAGLKILKWLLQIQTEEDGHLSIIGNNGWMQRNADRARFDQQPIEAMNLITACADAFCYTGDQFWLQEARKSFDWFFGGNDGNVAVYDYKTGGCFDGLTPQGINENMGAESTLAWLISLLTMHEIFHQEILLKEKN